MVPYMINQNSITLVLDNKSHTLPSTHPNFDRIKDAIKAGEWDQLPDLVDIPAAVVKFGEGKVTVVDGEVQYQGRTAHNVIADRIIQMSREGFNVAPLALFLENLMQNPSRTAVEELYLFMESGHLPLTEDGHFLAYKKVGVDYLDIHSHKFDNHPGQVLEMPRNEVDDVRDRICSYGFHFCSESYLPHYGSATGNHVVIVKINPRDVVSIPSDYNNAKGRTCRYEVVGELNYDFTNETMGKSAVVAPTPATWELHVAALDQDGDYLKESIVIVDNELTSNDLDEAMIDIDEWPSLINMIAERIVGDVDTDTIRIRDYTRLS